jgi:hypothetical protein
VKPLYIAAVIALTLAACHHPVPVPTPSPEAFEQMLFRTERVTCADITYHDYGDTPDCKLVYEAWVRGRNRVAAIYPVAAEYKMVGIGFYRPRLLWVDDRPYPLIADAPGNPRGLTYVQGGVQITYSYEHVIEHEAVHALVFLVDGIKVRPPDAVTQDMGGYRPEDFLNLPFYLYLIGCHNTPDDIFGDGPPGHRTGCVLPYVSPVS